MPDITINQAQQEKYLAMEIAIENINRHLSEQEKFQPKTVLDVIQGEVEFAKKYSDAAQKIRGFEIKIKLN